MNKNNQSFFQKIGNKYKLIVSDESTFEVLVSLRVSRANIIAATAIFSLLLITLLLVLIAFTPLKEFIPGYPNENTRAQIERNAILADSLAQRIKEKEQFFQGIKNIISGNDTANNKTSHTIDSTTVVDVKNVKFSRSASDSIFRKKHEENEKYNLGISKNKEQKNLPNILFYTPIKGIISTKFNPQEKHFGVDIAGNNNSRISSILDGTVVFAGWTLDTGYVIQIQHSNNLISIYKHNAELLKKEGAQVKSGEAIALLGNSGELSSGPHLHFEIWHNGVALNPEHYIKF